MTGTLTEGRIGVTEMPVRSNPLDVVAIVQLSRATNRKMIRNLARATG